MLPLVVCLKLKLKLHLNLNLKSQFRWWNSRVWCDDFFRYEILKCQCLPAQKAISMGNVLCVLLTSFFNMCCAFSWREILDAPFVSLSAHTHFNILFIIKILLCEIPTVSLTSFMQRNTNLCMLMCTVFICPRRKIIQGYGCPCTFNVYNLRIHIQRKHIFLFWVPFTFSSLPSL